MTGTRPDLRLAAAALAALFTLPALAGGRLAATSASADCADVALVLAVDTSGSIDAGEFALQVQGLAAAFRDPRVVAALEAAGDVDVGAVFWGHPGTPPHVLPFRRIASGDGAAAVATGLEAGARQLRGDTGIGPGIEAALDLLAAGSPCAGRAIINLSGDGRASAGRRGDGSLPLAAARARAEAAGVTINGLAILDAVPDLAGYYRARVATGPGAFVMEAAATADFAAAIARKIAREVAPPMLAALSGSGPAAAQPEIIED